MKPVRNNLVALGSAAVFTVYSAGFLRTKAAADRFAGEDAERGRMVVAQEHDPGAPPALPTVPAAADLAPAPQSDRAQVERARTAQTAAKRSEPKPAVDTATSAPRPATDSAPTPQVVVPPTPTPAPVTPVQAVAVVAQAADSAAQKKEAQLKDGLYSGWGTSRHGDIQASVEIRDGRIISASITQCLTRYSCSWIAHLPGQVVSRQGPDVDYVSGATQSSNAFYYAIVEALSKAK